MSDGLDNVKWYRRLLADTNAVIDEYLARGDLPKDGVNVADLACRAVKCCVSDSGNAWIEVLIEEADPSCHALNEFVTKRLAELGHRNVHSVTEW